MKVLMFIIMFLLLGAFFIVSNENIKLDSRENVGYLFQRYGLWLDNLVNNGKSVTGYLVKMEWLPG